MQFNGTAGIGLIDRTGKGSCTDVNGTLNRQGNPTTSGGSTRFNMSKIAFYGSRHILDCW